jgi:proteasome lid subunit RPN8/RPN11
MRLRIEPAVMCEIFVTLRRAYPEEGCGVLLGRDTGEGREVVRVASVDNVSAENRGRRYLIAPEQFLAAERSARDAGLDVVGFFHSHPDHPAVPSSFDLEHAWPYYSYLIVSVGRDGVREARAWRLAEDRSGFEPEALDVVTAEIT